jgi:hypothetical protein
MPKHTVILERKFSVILERKFSVILERKFSVILERSDRIQTLQKEKLAGFSFLYE